MKNGKSIFSHNTQRFAVSFFNFPFNLISMEIVNQIYSFSLIIIASLVIASCSKNDDDPSNNHQNDLVTIEDGGIAFDVSDFENTSMEGEVTYYLNNQYNIKYFQVSNNEAIYHNGRIWNITFEQNSNNHIALPEPGEYPIVQGLSNTYNQNSFNATISMFTDTMTDLGTHFGGNNGSISGTINIVSNTNNIIKGTFSFEAYSSAGEKITVTNGQFAAPKNAW